MEHNKAPILPLYTFFESLRQNGFPLGIGDYERLLYALGQKLGLGVAGYNTLLAALGAYIADTGIDLVPWQELQRLCKLLWLKPGQNVQLFEDLFNSVRLPDIAKTGAGDNVPVAKPTKRSKPDDLKLGADDDKAKEDDGRAAVKQPAEKAINQQVETVYENDSDVSEEVPVRIGVGKTGSVHDLQLNQADYTDIEQTKFIFTKKYYPIDRRKLQQNLKNLPLYREDYFSDDIDIPATINATTDRGYFKNAIYRRHKVNTGHVLLLIDNSESMIAFAQLGDFLRQELAALFYSGRAKEATLHIYYYYNAAAGHFYTNNTYTNAVSVGKLQAFIKNKQASVIILSDAGAALDEYRKDKEAAAEALLRNLQKSTRKVAWINPFPKNRWQPNVTAIEQAVAMFEGTEAGIKNAVDFLKGSCLKNILHYED